MSVSLVVIRFEILDHLELPIHLEYTAPDFKIHAQESEKRRSYAEVVDSKQIPEDVILMHRGYRKIGEIAIQTIIMEGCESITELNNEVFDDSTEKQESGIDTGKNTDPSKDDTSRNTPVSCETNSAIANINVEKRESVSVTNANTSIESDESASKQRSCSESSSPLSVDIQKSVRTHRRSSTPSEMASYQDESAGPRPRQGKQRHSPTGALLKDSNYRFSPIDSRHSPVISEEGSVGSGSRPSSARSRQSSHSPNTSLPNTIKFMSGNQRTEVTEGILHLYKDNNMIPLKEDLSRSELICMLAVPAALTTHDLLNFVSPVYPSIEHMRIIRDKTPNQYMVLIKFRSQKGADEFYSTFNNCPFNSIEGDICHLVYVAKVEMQRESQGACLPVPGLTELPNCPVCLERMDETVEGILTVLCNHSFHGACLGKWGDTSCPVCRYVQTPEVSDDNKCLKCNSNESLWICLICGYVGCGRYNGGHAYEHFKETEHTYSMQLGNNRVWDYAGDNYVHRLIQSKGEGKLVEVDERGNPMSKEKVDHLSLEYTYFFTLQLEKQRQYFEEQITRIETENQEQIKEVEERAKKTLEECEKLEHKLAEANKDKQIVKKKCTELTGKLTKTTRELQDERELNHSLCTNQSQWQEKINKLETQMKQMKEEKDTELKDLKEQLRDVMFYFEAQQKLSTTTEVTQEEIEGGQIVVGAAGPSPGKSTRKAKKKR